MEESKAQNQSEHKKSKEKDMLSDLKEQRGSSLVVTNNKNW